MSTLTTTTKSSAGTLTATNKASAGTLTTTTKQNLISAGTMVGFLSGITYPSVSNVLTTINKS